MFRYLTIVLACAACSSLCGCRQTATRLEISDLQPSAAATGSATSTAPIVRAIPELDDHRTTAYGTPQRLAGTQELPRAVDHRTGAETQPRRSTASTEARVTDDRGVFGVGIGSLLGQQRIPQRSLEKSSRVNVVSVGFNEQLPPSTDVTDTQNPFAIPSDLPGAESPDLTLPPLDPNEPVGDQRQAIRELYKTLPELPQARIVTATPDQRPLSLAELQQTAYSRSPVINRAWADIDAARGRAVQAGLCPNPVVGYEGDTINTLGTAGYNGLFFEQTYVTCGKLGLAQQVAVMEVRAAEYAYRRARVEVATDVRDAYFGVLMAQERVRLARAMSTLTQEAYNAQIELVTGGQSAAYEPLQLKVSALRARNAVVTAENDYQGSWRELAAALNEPTMLPLALAGSVETPTGELNFDAARSAMLSRHTDLSIAQAQIAEQNYNLELQRRTPIPNLELYSAIQHDDTNSRNDVSYNVQIGLPLPVFNRNQGNIQAANAELVRAQHNRISTQNELSARLAEAYARYVTSRELAETYRSQIVPSQVQTFRSVYTRFRSAGGDVDFSQVIVSQQTLADVLREYLDTLSAEWDAAVDVAEILQVEDIYTMDGLASPPQLEPVPAR